MRMILAALLALSAQAFAQADERICAFREEPPHESVQKHSKIVREFVWEILKGSESPTYKANRLIALIENHILPRFDLNSLATYSDLAAMLSEKVPAQSLPESDQSLLSEITSAIDAGVKKAAEAGDVEAGEPVSLQLTAETAMEAAKAVAFGYVKL